MEYLNTYKSFKQINESFKIDDMDVSLSKINDLENEILSTKNSMGKHQQKLSYMLISILDTMEEKHDINDIFEFFDANYMQHPEGLSGLENVYVEHRGYNGGLCGFEKSQGNWFVTVCEENSDSRIQVLNLESWYSYEILQGLLSVPFVISAINIDIFKQINEAFGINNIETEYLRYKRMYAEVSSLRYDFDPHKEKIIEQLTTILDKLLIDEDEDGDNIFEEDGLFEYLDQWEIPDTNTKTTYGDMFSMIEEEDEDGTYLLRNLHIKHGRDSSKYMISGDTDNNDYEFSLSNTSAICLYQILRLLLTVPHINGLMNIDIFKDINETFKLPEIDKHLAKISKQNRKVTKVKEKAKKKIEKHGAKLSEHRGKLSSMLETILTTMKEKHNIDDLFEYLVNNEADYETCHHCEIQNLYFEDGDSNEEYMIDGFQYTNNSVWEANLTSFNDSYNVMEIKHMGTDNLYWLLQILLNIPFIIETLNMDVFTEINKD